MQFFLWVFAAVAGVLNTIQSGSNATLSKTLDQPILAAICVYLVGLAGALVAALIVGVHWPEQDKLASVPWWAWIGGLLGGVYVLAMLTVANRMGAALFMGLTVTAAIVTSLAMDHFGLVGFEKHVAGWPRIAGAVLMIGGLGLIARY